MWGEVWPDEWSGVVGVGGVISSMDDKKFQKYPSNSGTH